MIFWKMLKFFIREVTMSHSVMSYPMDYSLPGSSVHGDSPGKNTGVGCHALLQGIFPTKWSNPSPTLQVDSSSEPLGKPPNTGMGSISLLQGSFPIQELNQGLLAGGLLTSWATRETLRGHNNSACFFVFIFLSFFLFACSGSSLLHLGFL